MGTLKSSVSTHSISPRDGRPHVSDLRAQNKPAASRRHFLLQSMTGLGSVWLTASWPEVLRAHDHARHAATASRPARFKR